MIFETKNKDFNRILRKCSNIEEYRIKHIELLRQSSSYGDLLWANKVEVSSSMFAEPNMKQLNQIWQMLHDYLIMLSQKTGIKMEFDVRRKAYVSFCRKIQLHIVKKMPIDEIFDELGMRIIIGESLVDEPILLNLCDIVMNEIIDFFITIGGVPKDLRQTYKTGTTYPEGVLIQKKSLINPDYKNNVKNYIAKPKLNGYQGLHSVIQMANGVLFEVQVRTKAMHNRAEEGDAKHTIYKDERYRAILEKGEEIFDLSFNQTNIEGISLRKDGSIEDKVGFIQPIKLF